jgi:hypothetical protein
MAGYTLSTENHNPKSFVVACGSGRSAPQAGCPRLADVAETACFDG